MDREYSGRRLLRLLLVILKTKLCYLDKVQLSSITNYQLLNAVK